jgi:DNA-binding CsgD family transcriptional regulator
MPAADEHGRCRLVRPGLRRRRIFRGMSTSAAVSEGSGVPVSSPGPVSLADVLGRAQLQVLRVTVLVCFLIATGNLIGAILGFTSGSHEAGTAALLAAAWCVLWATAAASPELTARRFRRWRTTGLALALANAVTVAVTGGVASPILAVCMYVGWIASVVVRPRAAIAMSFGISGSLVAGYLIAGDSFADILTGPSRYDALANVLLPILAGVVGALLATVTNGIFNRLAEILDGLRHGAPATSPGLTALFAGRPVLALPAPPSPTPARLTPTEREVVKMLGAGHRAKQIALSRGVKLSTVRSQVKAAKRKTGARTLSELVAIVVEAGSE